MNKIRKILEEWFGDNSQLKEGYMISKILSAEKEILELVKEEKMELKNEIIQDAYNLMENDYGTNDAEHLKRELELLNREE